MTDLACQEHSSLLFLCVCLCIALKFGHNINLTFTYSFNFKFNVPDYSQINEKCITALILSDHTVLACVTEEMLKGREGILITACERGPQAGAQL